MMARGVSVSLTICGKNSVATQNSAATEAKRPSQMNNPIGNRRRGGGGAGGKLHGPRDSDKAGSPRTIAAAKDGVAARHSQNRASWKGALSIDLVFLIDRA